jgi:hypothetical protein
VKPAPGPVACPLAVPPAAAVLVAALAKEPAWLEVLAELPVAKATEETPAAVGPLPCCTCAPSSTSASYTSKMTASQRRR